MRRQLAWFVFLFLCLQRLGAESLVTGVAGGAWTDDRAPVLGYSMFQGGPVLAGAAALYSPPGAGAVSPNAYSFQLYGLGWNISGPDWSHSLFVGLIPSTPVATDWGNDEVTWNFGGSIVAVSVNRWGPWVFGGADLESSGRILASTVDVGGFHGGARLLFFGYPAFGLFASELDATLESRVSILDLAPLDAQGELRAWALGLWGRGEWRWGAWTFTVDGAAGLLWAVQNSWTIVNQSLTYSFLTGFGMTTSETNYAFVASPAWGLLVHPAVNWQLARGWTVAAGRWIPLTGGWRVSQGGSALAAPATPVSGSPRPFSSSDLENLLLAGTEVTVKFEW